MEIAIIVVGILLIIIGFAGSILPALPGPPLAYGALLLLLISADPRAEMANNNYIWLIAFGIITAIITAVDYLMPIWGTKKFGGTKAGSRGSTIGLVVGALLAFFLQRALVLLLFCLGQL